MSDEAEPIDDSLFKSDLFKSDLFKQMMMYAKMSGFLRGALSGLRYRVNDEIKAVIDDILKQVEHK